MAFSHQDFTDGDRLKPAYLAAYQAGYAEIVALVVMAAQTGDGEQFFRVNQRIKQLHDKKEMFVSEEARAQMMAACSASISQYYGDVSQDIKQQRQFERERDAQQAKHLAFVSMIIQENIKPMVESWMKKNRSDADRGPLYQEIEKYLNNLHEAGRLTQAQVVEISQMVADNFPDPSRVRSIHILSNGKYAVTLQRPVVEHLVISGGGAKGVALGGAFQVLEQRGILAGVQDVAGASAGAMAALLLAVGMSADEISKMLSEVDITKYIEFNALKLKRDSGERLYQFMANILHDQFEKLLKIVDQDKLKNAYSESLYLKLKNKLEKNEYFTFSDLKDLKTLLPMHAAHKIKDLHIVITNKQTGEMVHCSADTMPDTDLARAAQVSGAHPVMFDPYVDKEGMFGKKGAVYNDGGIVNNAPISMVKQHAKQHLVGKATLCLIFSDDSAYAKTHQTLLGSAQRISSPIRQLFKASMGRLAKPLVGAANFMVKDLETKENIRENSGNVIVLNTGTITTTDTGASTEAKANAIQLSAQVTEEYFAQRQDEVLMLDFDDPVSVALALDEGNANYFRLHPESINIANKEIKDQLMVQLDMVQQKNAWVNEIVANINSDTRDGALIQTKMERLTECLPIENRDKYLKILEERMDVLTSGQFSKVKSELNIGHATQSEQASALEGKSLKDALKGSFIGVSSFFKQKPSSRHPQEIKPTPSSPNHSQKSQNKG